MKKQIPAIVLIVFGLALTASNPVPGLVFVVIGVVVFVMTKNKNKKKEKQVQAASGPVEFRSSVTLKPNTVKRERNPRFADPKGTKKVYEYRFFDKECRLEDTGKAINVVYDDEVVGYVNADEVEFVRDALGSLLSEPRLAVYGGGVKEWDGAEWVEDKIPTRAEVRLTYMR